MGLTVFGTMANVPNLANLAGSNHRRSRERLVKHLPWSRTPAPGYPAAQ